MLSPVVEQEVSDAVAGAEGPLRLVGGGTRPVGRPVTGEVLSVAGVSGIELFEPGALTIVARAGTPLAEIEAALAAENQRLPFEPMDLRGLLGTAGEPTIGGVVAANASGPRRIQAGACRDSLIGVRFVDGRGTVVKNGGRVMKNVTGYDLVKLMAGSWGTLGVLTEVSLKVQARPETEATLVGRGLDLRAGVAALARALGSPWDITGAAHLDVGGETETLVRIEGLAASVDYRVGALLGAGFDGWEVLRGADSAARWAAVRDVRAFAGDAVPVWRLSVKPGDAPAVAENLVARGVAHRGVYDWGGGLMWLAVETEAADAGAGVIRAVLAGVGGHATLVRGDEALRARIDVFQPESVPLATLTRGIKQKFDPRGLLNPGLMGV